MTTFKLITRLLDLGYKVCGHSSRLGVIQLSKGKKMINLFQTKWYTYCEYWNDTQKFYCDTELKG